MLNRDIDTAFFKSLIRNKKTIAYNIKTELWIEMEALSSPKLESGGEKKATIFSKQSQSLRRNTGEDSGK